MKSRRVLVAVVALTAAGIATGALSFQSVDAGVPRPFVVNAREGSPQRVAAKPLMVVPNGRGDVPVAGVGAVDGCNHNYGTVNQCIPNYAPGHKAVTCAILTKEGYLRKPLVINRDTLGLLGKHAHSVTAFGQRYITGCSD